MIQWHIETRKLSKLKNHPKNPRQLSKLQEEQITQSLQRFGLADKPIINTDGTIIGGHQRKRILAKLGYKEIECWVPDRQLSDKEVDELNVRLNLNAGEFDYDILANEFEIPDLVDWGFTLDDLHLTEDDMDDKEQTPKTKQQKVCPNCGHGL